MTHSPIPAILEAVDAGCGLDSSDSAALVDALRRAVAELGRVSANAEARGRVLKRAGDQIRQVQCERDEARATIEEIRILARVLCRVMGEDEEIVDDVGHVLDMAVGAIEDTRREGDEARAEAAKLRQALEAVEWMAGRVDLVGWCPACFNTRREGHAPSCLTGQALAR